MTDTDGRLDKGTPHASGTLSRRALLGGAMAASATAAAGLAPGVTRALARPRRARAGRGLPSSGELGRAVEDMVRLGPRLPGTRPHRDFVDSIEQGFRRAGLDVQRDRHTFTRWSQRGRAIELLDGPDPGGVPVASYYTYSGSTPPGGIVRELAYAGPLPPLSITGNPLDLVTIEEAIESFRRELVPAVTAALAAVPGGVADRIVLMEAPIAPLPVGSFYPLLTYQHDPERTISPTDDYKRAWTTLLTLPVLEPFKRAGAAGVVFALDASPENAEGQYTPFIHPLQELPALIVDREAGARLRRAAAVRPRVLFTLDASVRQDVRSDSLVALLPGADRAGENMILHTHTDGQNAFEENGPIASVALARHFARLPRSERRRDLVFSCVTGHFGPGLPETEGFIEDHPDLVEKAAAAVTIEHFGTFEWLDDARGYYPTGRTELGAVFHSQTPIALPAIESLQAVDLRRTALLRPIGVAFFGVGAPLHEAGVPSLAFIAGPHYLLALDGGEGHLDKFSAERMHREMEWTADVLRRLDGIPAAVLRAGDSAALSARRPASARARRRSA